MFSRPLHPLLILVVAVILPGMGQVLNGMLVRAWIMIFFALSLGVVTYHLTTPAHSFIGRHAGGFFIYAIMVMDAYLWSRYRYARWQQSQSSTAT
ncbi:MAG: hypothetical protein RL564_1665 [Pseudomonadota bacterium]|jgi:hypothetical protein